MFRESLIESLAVNRKRKRWPMAFAFVLECAAAAVVIAIPLLSSGVIPVAAHVPPIIAPIPVVRVATDNSQQAPTRGAAISSPMQRVVSVPQSQNRIYAGPSVSFVDGPAVDPAKVPLGQSGPGPTLACLGCSHVTISGPSHDDKPRMISRLDPAQLVHRVEPRYPKPAVLINLQGEVKLHAIIAKDGTIQSLGVTSGHPLLAQAALDAVRQWRYRPYVLNREAVEVETFITVNFRRDR